MDVPDATHDPDLRSWVDSANSPDTDFPIQNLPLGVFATSDSDAGRGGIAIGGQILDIGRALDEGIFSGPAADAAALCRRATLNDLFASGRAPLRALRAQTSAFLRAGSEWIRRDPMLADRVLVAQSDAQMRLPVTIGDYTDFYASIYHATNVGKMFRPDNPLLPNYKYVPIGYHGRASSVVVSGTAVHRPNGQTKAADAPAPTFGPTRSLDYEAEVGLIVGAGNALGTPVAIDEAESHLVGLCLVNDWSARDVQTWEYQPLGPFLAKSFATTVSPWVVTLDALEPFRVPAFARPDGDPAPLPYLVSPENTRRGCIDITLEVLLRSDRMRASHIAPVSLSRSRFADLYWTPAQMVAHHTSNGCNLRPGDLLASGTISGPTPDALGCLLELTARGTRPLTLPTGERRGFLEDGDEVTLRATCHRNGACRIGFGECRGVVVGSL
jgi:fumarylacetoacetase